MSATERPSLQQGVYSDNLRLQGQLLHSSQLVSSLSSLRRLARTCSRLYRGHTPGSVGAAGTSRVGVGSAAALLQIMPTEASTAAEHAEEVSTHLLPRLHPERCCKAWCRETPLRDRSSSGEFEQKCEQKASDFESRQQLRAEEIVALEKANEIISSGAVAGNAEKHLPTLLQTSSFAQLRVDLSTQAQSRVARYLSAQANKLNSRVLSALATRVADDPFHKVKKMIKDLIERLMEEAGWGSQRKRAAL